MAIHRPLTIPISALSDARPWSLHRSLTSEPSGHLVESIKRFGLLKPPLVIERPDGGLELISGAYRLQALRTLLGQKEISCLVISPQTDNKSLLLLAAADQMLSGPLSPIEKAHFIKLAEHMTEPDQADLVQSTIGIRSVGHQQRLIKLLNLEPPIQIALQTGRISEKNGVELLRLSSKDRLFLNDLFERLDLNDHKQRRIVELGNIITTRPRCSFHELFTNNYSDLIRPDKPDNVPQAIAKLLKDLQVRSHPLSSEAERSFVEQVGRLGLPENCSVTPSPAFEKDTVTLSVSFDNINALERVWRSIKSQIS